MGNVDNEKQFRLRLARHDDEPAIRRLIADSVRGLGSADYTAEQVESSLTYLFGVDRRLIDDGTYFVVETGNRIVGAGGWSARRTLFGGDQYASRSDERLDPSSEAARIRAFYVSPEFSRRGLGTMLVSACERAARGAGFRRLELMATLTGIPLYERSGFRVVEPTEITLPDGIRFPLARMERDLS